MAAEISRKVDTGTILDALNVRNISKLHFILPPLALLDGFEKCCRPIRMSMEQHLAENSILTAIRDALLPKLLSGQLRVREAEQILESAV